MVAAENTVEFDDGGASLRSQVQVLEADLARRQESYIRRERAYNLRVEELEGEVARLKSGRSGWMQEDKNMKVGSMWMLSTVLRSPHQ